MRHFLKETDFSAEELPTIFALAQQLKAERKQPELGDDFCKIKHPHTRVF